MREPLIDRRTVLRGAGAAIALPWLEAMLPRGIASTALAATTATEAAPPLRVAYLFFPNGVNVDAWTPTADAHGLWVPSPTLAPLADFRGDIDVYTGLRHRNGLVLQERFHVHGLVLRIAPNHVFETVSNVGGKFLHLKATVGGFGPSRLFILPFRVWRNDLIGEHLSDRIMLRPVRIVHEHEEVRTLSSREISRIEGNHFLPTHDALRHLVLGRSPCDLAQVCKGERDQRTAGQLSRIRSGEHR